MKSDQPHVIGAVQAQGSVACRVWASWRIFSVLSSSRPISTSRCCLQHRAPTDGQRRRGYAHVLRYSQGRGSCKFTMFRSRNSSRVVDAASGGFVAPLVDPNFVWGIRLEKVISINVSGHKNHPLCLNQKRLVQSAMSSSSPSSKKVCCLCFYHICPTNETSLLVCDVRSFDFAPSRDQNKDSHLHPYPPPLPQKH